MSRRSDELVNELLDGELDAAGRRELDALLAADPGLVEESAVQWRLHRMLPVVTRGPEGDHFVQNLRRALRPASSRFRIRVQKDLRASRPRPPPRLRFPAWFGIAASLVVAFLVLWATHRTNGSTPLLAKIVSCPAGVVINGQRVEASRAIGLALKLDDVVSTKASESLWIGYADGTQVRLGASTEIQFAAWPAPTLVPGRKQVRMKHGELAASVAKQPPGASMLISTAQALVEVVGTEYALVADADSTRLETTRGAVTLTRWSDRASLTIAAGEFAVVRNGVDFSVRSAATTAPLPNAIPPGGALPEALLSFDFEDGIQPAGWIKGKVMTGPTRPGNRYCLSGEHDSAAPWTMVKLDAGADGTLFIYDSTVELSFDYWVDERVGSLDFYAWNDNQQDSFGSMDHHLPIPARSTRTWTRATVRLEGWHTPDAKRMADGDRIRQLSIQAGQQGGVVLLDNMRLTRQRPSRLKPDGD